MHLLLLFYSILILERILPLLTDVIYDPPSTPFGGLAEGYMNNVFEPLHFPGPNMRNPPTAQR